MYMRNSLTSMVKVQHSLLKENKVVFKDIQHWKWVLGNNFCLGVWVAAYFR